MWLIWTIVLLAVLLSFSFSWLVADHYMQLRGFKKVLMVLTMGGVSYVGLFTLTLMLVWPAYA